MKSPKSNINFDFIEFEISEKDLENFKKSIAQGCIRRVDQITASKWHYLMKSEDRLLEIEVSYNKSNVKQFQCACGARSPGKLCKHVQLVSYWHVTTVRIKNESNASEFNSVSNDLSHSTEEDLKYYIFFLAKQSKLNKEWLHFFDSARIINTDPFQKYISLVTHFFHFVTSQTRNSASKIKFQLQLFEELYYISFYHYKHSNIEEALCALLSGISKLHEWHLVLDWKNQSRLIAINEKMHAALEQFLTSVVAPRVLNKFYKMSSELVAKPEYLILNDKSNLFNILSSRFNKESKSKHFFNSIIDKLNLNIRDDYKFLILDYLYKEYPPALKDYLITIEINKTVYWVLSWLESRKNRIASEYLLDLYVKIYDATTKEMKSLVALKIAELYGHNPDSVSGQLLIRYYLETGQVKLLESYFKEMDFTNDHFKLLLDDLEKNLGKIKLSLSQKIDLAFYSKQWTLLIGLLHESDDIELLVKYDSEFPDEYHLQLINSYVKITKGFLDTHVGHKSHQKFESIARHIKSVYRNKYYSIYLNEIKHLFPNRKLIPQI